MNTRGTDLNIWIPGRQISVYEYQGDTNNQTQQWNNDFTYLCRILVILYVFIITEQGCVLSKCVCVHVCMYVHSLSPVYTNTYIFTIRLVQKQLWFGTVNFKSLQLGSNTSLLIRIGTITVYMFLPTRNKFAYSCSIEIHAQGFEELLESIFCILLVVEEFSLQKVLEMLEEGVVGLRELR